jgi:hypothetical protein
MAHGHFNPDINPRLLKLIEGMKYDKYNVNPTSGYRPGDPRQHGRGQAIDIQLSDPKTQAALANYQDPATFKAYQDYANAVYQQALQNDPELAKQLRWGGYFSGGRGKYGALDLMHFDTANQSIGMGGGSWEGGLNPDQAKIWGLQAGGGVGELDAQMQAAGYTPEQRRNAIASIESAGSGDYGALGAFTGDPVEGRDRAYGRYQVMGSNIAPWAEQYLGQKGVTSDMFMKDPALQDKLFDAVYGDYVNKYGERGAASKWFTGSEKEPPRSDVHGELTGKSYADRYTEALQGSGAGAAKDSPGEGGGRFGGTGLGTPAQTVAAGKKSNWIKDMFGGMKAAGTGNVATPPVPNLPDLPKAALASAQAGPGIDPNRDVAQRQRLAEAMMKLNAGKLWV